MIHVPPPAGYPSGGEPFPVLLLPERRLHEDLPPLLPTVHSLIAAGAIPPVIVVGIPHTQRRRDMTGPPRFAADSAFAPRVGGSAAFRAFIPN